MFALHTGDNSSTRGTFVDKNLVIVIDIARPGASLQSKLEGGALEGPDPVLRSVVVNADDVSDGLVGRTLVVEVAVIIIGPVLTPGSRQAEKQENNQRIHSVCQLYWTILCYLNLCIACSCSYHYHIKPLNYYNV